MKNIRITITATIILAGLLSISNLQAQSEYSTLNKPELTAQPIEAYHYAAPNPFQDITYICFSSEEEGSYQLEVMNKMGQRVISKSGKLTKGDNRIQLYRSGLAADKYIYRLKYGKGNFKTGRLYIVD